MGRERDYLTFRCRQSHTKSEMMAVGCGLLALSLAAYLSGIMGGNEIWKWLKKKNSGRIGCGNARQSEPISAYFLWKQIRTCLNVSKRGSMPLHCCSGCVWQTGIRTWHGWSLSVIRSLDHITLAPSVHYSKILEKQVHYSNIYSTVNTTEKERDQSCNVQLQQHALLYSPHWWIGSANKGDSPQREATFGLLQSPITSGAKTRSTVELLVQKKLELQK